MQSVLIIGEGARSEELRRILVRAGVEVTVQAPTDGIAGNSATTLIVDDILDQLEATFLTGTSKAGHLPVGLLVSLASHSSESNHPSGAVPKYGNPRPYLRRKKGRS